MKRININTSHSVALRSVVAATALLALLGMFAVVTHAHDLHEVSGVDCVECRFQEAQSLDAPGVNAPVLKLLRSPFEAEAVDSLVVDQHYRLAPLRGPPSLA